MQQVRPVEPIVVQLGAPKCHGETTATRDAKGDQPKNWRATTQEPITRTRPESDEKYRITNVRC